jgi:hypothetical protein
VKDALSIDFLQQRRGEVNYNKSGMGKGLLTVHIAQYSTTPQWQIAGLVVSC